MFTLTFNGKPFDPDDFHDALMEAALDKVKEHLHEAIFVHSGPTDGRVSRGVRHWQHTGEHLRSGRSLAGVARTGAATA